MNEELHNNIEPVISANDGWLQMQALLNEYLPVKRQIIKRKQLPNVYTAILLTTFLFIALQLDNDTWHTVTGDHAVRCVTAFKTPANRSLTLNTNNKRTSFAAGLPGNPASFKRMNASLIFDNKYVLPVNPHNMIDPLTVAIKPTENMSASISKMLHGPVNAAPGDTTLYNLNKSRDKTKAKKSWTLLAGIGVNTSINNTQNLQPYPVAEARYNIAPNFFIAAGLSAWSPASAGIHGISKTIYLNDTINNISLYNETTTYNHLHYADIPLTLGINLTKNISVQSGFQMSVLLNKRTKKVLVPYDLQMNSIGAPARDPLSALAPGIQQEFDVQARTIDYRFIAGIRYSLKKTNVGVMYQQGLRTVGNGIHTNKNSNQLFALNMIFQIK